MPYAITLRLDDSAATLIEALQGALRDGVAEHAYPPHLTLAVCPDEAAEDALRATLADVARHWGALPIRLAGIGLFPGDPTVIWAAPVVTEDLLRRHASLHAALPASLRHPHYRPGAWMPHVTLRQGGGLPTDRMMARLLPLWRGPIAGVADRVELVRFAPPTVLWSRQLGEGGGGAA